MGERLGSSTKQYSRTQCILLVYSCIFLLFYFFNHRIDQMIDVSFRLRLSLIVFFNSVYAFIPVSSAIWFTNGVTGRCIPVFSSILPLIIVVKRHFLLNVLYISFFCFYVCFTLTFSCLTYEGPIASHSLLICPCDSQSSHSAPNLKRF